MSISPYVMDTLYRQGTIDFVPYDVLSPMQVNNVTGANSQAQGNQVTQQIEQLKQISRAPVSHYPLNIEENNNSVKYLNKSQAINTYNNYSTMENPLGADTGSLVEEIRAIKNQPVKKITESNSLTSDILTDEDKKGTGRAQANPKIWPKAMISIGAITLMLVALFTRGSALWSKLNPLNWFK